MVMDHQFGTDEGSFITMREIGKYTGIPLHRKVGQFGTHQIEKENGKK